MTVWLCGETFQYSELLHNVLQPRAFSQLLRADLLVHELPQTFFGGPCGVKLIALHLMRESWTTKLIRAGDNIPHRNAQVPEPKVLDEWKQCVESDLLLVRNTLKHSIKSLTTMHTTRPGAPAFKSIAPGYSRASVMPPAAIADKLNSNWRTGSIMNLRTIGTLKAPPPPAVVLTRSGPQEHDTPRKTLSPDPESVAGPLCANKGKARATPRRIESPPDSDEESQGNDDDWQDYDVEMAVATHMCIVVF
ncbi:hypothetical protein FRC12_018124 [Ceratobasidium sp. 428]|nr:hypothetical protein FRC12_018124 [Ceratobasidium sp. 428]